MQSLIRKIGWFGIVLNFIVVALYFNTLPDEIPRHFNAAGEPDAYGTKYTLFLLPTIGLLLYMFINSLSYKPQIFNYAVKITEENKDTQYDIAVNMVLLLNLTISLLFLYINISMIMIGMGKWKNLGNWFMPVLLIVIFGNIGWSIYQSKKNT